MTGQIRPVKEVQMNLWSEVPGFPCSRPNTVLKGYMFFLESGLFSGLLISRPGYNDSHVSVQMDREG